MAGEMVSEGWADRVVGSIRRTVLRRGRGMTDLEYALTSEVADLRLELSRAMADLAESKTHNAVLESSLRVANMEVLKLAEVVERDRRRVEAETAGYARKIADSQNPS
jgi:hypothetical protein